MCRSLKARKLCDRRWATDAYEEVVFVGQESGYLTLSFAAVLPAYDDIYVTGVRFAEQPQSGRHSDQDVSFGAPIRVDDHICSAFEFVHNGLGFVAAYRGVRRGIRSFRLPLFVVVSLFQNLGRGSHVYVRNGSTVRFPDCVDLFLNSDRINYDAFVVGSAAQLSVQALQNPRSAGFPIQSFAFRLEVGSARMAWLCKGGSQQIPGPEHVHTEPVCQVASQRRFARCHRAGQQDYSSIHASLERGNLSDPAL